MELKPVEKKKTGKVTMATRTIYTAHFLTYSPLIYINTVQRTQLTILLFIFILLLTLLLLYTNYTLFLQKNSFISEPNPYEM